MTTGCYETRFFLFVNARGGGTLLTAKCPATGTHRASNIWDFPGGILAAGIDWHIKSAGGKKSLRAKFINTKDKVLHVLLIKRLSMKRQS